MNESAIIAPLASYQNYPLTLGIVIYFATPERHTWYITSSSEKYRYSYVNLVYNRDLKLLWI